jgi:hypothetical protein
VFGDLPFEVCPISRGIGISEARFSKACQATQGVPAVFPRSAVLATLGVPQHFHAPAIKPPSDGALLGHTVCGPFSSPVALPANVRAQHVAIIGSSGAGKSSLMLQMIAQDLADPERRFGACLIDPHGDLFERTLEIVPVHRRNDVVLVDVTDPKCTVSLNPLEGMGESPQVAAYITSEVMNLIEMLFETRDSTGPMIRNNLKQLLLLAACVPGRHPTFLDALRIMEDNEFRDSLISKCESRNVRDFWTRFKNSRGDEYGYAMWMPYMMARLGPFTTNPVIRRLICQPASTIDLGRAMRERKIVLFNLSKSVLQDVECQILGALILMKIQGAALARARLSVTERVPFNLYVDEFQTFATDSAPRMFSEARKYGLGITVACQALGQLRHDGLKSKLAQSILANTATKLLFRLGPSDCEEMLPYYKGSMSVQQMARLPDFHALACMVGGSRPLEPFMMRCEQATVPVDACDPDDLLARSRGKYGMPITTADQILSQTFAL